MVHVNLKKEIAQFLGVVFFNLIIEKSQCFLGHVK